jgi:hypothetical protein
MKTDQAPDNKPGLIIKAVHEMAVSPKFRKYGLWLSQPQKNIMLELERLKLGAIDQAEFERRRDFFMEANEKYRKFVSENRKATKENFRDFMRREIQEPDWEKHNQLKEWAKRNEYDNDQK